MIVIRDAAPADIGAITEITNALIATTTYEWTSTPHTAADRLEWLDRHDPTATRCSWRSTPILP